MPEKKQAQKKHIPTAEKIQEELEKANSIDDLFGREGVMARLLGDMLTEMMKGELTNELGYGRYESKGRNSGNSRNGNYARKIKSSQGEIDVEVPRDRQGEYKSQILEHYQTRTNELEEKIIAMYAKGVSVRDIEETLRELYGVDVESVKFCV